ncbi:MAG: transposase [Elusimicrobia bacterium]|nr:transposase [Elusimicrobiota bacterium]
MPRQARIDISGLLYHVILRGIERRDIFPGKEDRGDFINRLSKNLEGDSAKCFAWALMSNHAHLLIRTGEKKLSGIMRGLLSGYATKFNVRHKRSGHLFQNRYKAIICEEEAYLLELIRYIHLNPVRAKIVADMKGLDDYEWTGHAVIMGKSEKGWQETGEVLERFGSSLSMARANYRKFAEEGIGLGKQSKFNGGGLIRSAGGLLEVLRNRKDGTIEKADERILGGGEFVESILKVLEEKDKIKDKVKRELDVEKLAEKVSKYYGLKVSRVKGESRMRKITKARAVFVNLGMDYLGLNGRRFEKELKVSSSGISKLYRRWGRTY